MPLLYSCLVCIGRQLGVLNLLSVLFKIEYRFKVSTGKPRRMIAGLPCSLNLIRDWVIRLVMYCKPNQRLGY